MILVTLGTQDYPFERLLKQIDKEILKGNIKEKVIVQSGYTKYKSKNMTIFDLITNEKLNDLMKEANLIITHGGVGSIINALKNKKVIIAAARLKKYHEVTNDHQKQIIKRLAEQGYILELKNFNKLGNLIKESKKFKPRKFNSNTSKMTKLITDYIEDTNHISWLNRLKRKDPNE